MKNRSYYQEGSKGRWRVKEGNKEGEYGGYTFYTGMNIEFLNLLKRRRLR
jgi:hypothetical protein